MRLILKKEIENLGNFGDIVKVAPGYGRNFLIPQGFATEVTPGNMKQFEAEKEAFLKKAVVKKDKAEQLKLSLESISLSFARKTGEDDKLFGSVTVHDIESALKAKGYEFERKDILLSEPLKSLGQTSVAVKLHPQVTANITVEVVKE